MSASKTESIFSNVPDDGDEGMRYQIIRTGPKGIKGPIVTSHDPLGLYTHWAGGRTLPCVKKACEHCEQNVSRRWYGFLMVYSIKQDRQYLFEYTASAASTVVQYWEKHRTLRGAAISGERQGGRPNGRLTLFLTPPKSEAEPLPKAPERVSLLSQMWSVPLSEFLEPQSATKKQAEEFIEQIRPTLRAVNE